jgi:signal transduction histidine kinase
MMASLVDSLLPPQSDAHGVLSRALSQVRWVTIAVLLLLTLARPLPSRAHLPMWAVVLGFAAYNLLIDLLRTRLSWLHSFARVAILDLPVTALVYSFGYELSGPFFSLLILTLFTAAASTRPRGSLLYTGLVMAVVAAVAPTFPLWSPDEQGFRDLIARLIVVAVVGVSTTVFMRELWDEQERGRLMRSEAERLGELERLRGEFISSVSHDLRTPLTAARLGVGLVETSTGERLRADERTLLGNSKRNIERLGLLIDDLLAYNQLQAGALTLDLEPLDLRTVVADAMPVVHPLMEQKSQRLEVDLPEPLWVRGDPRRLEQVVVNLLVNAHRHTPPGTRVSVRGASADGVAVVRVSDDGPGIPPGEREAVFERFRQLSSTEGGSGLGLAIARSIAELHGGRLWADGEPGEGATFSLAIPSYPKGGGA